ncbi:aggregation-promoting factor C-terminal-like domain-containing protein [Microterricola pindariensis]|uniref:Lytic transglycosylase domain-containing protein n=1 Tax=Microterricola pindariensis TaxID=478010 RepID=A0ABX5AQZ9_9MICO|nr:lytic transglycosylase domain-containing protein [Microterricola pindariensis]PPL14473.1 hypothetical protein GY24_16205 [Microterricola pindariensis]
MGRHTGILQPVHSGIAPRARYQRPRTRGRAALFSFAFTAAVAFVLVSIVDPYSGAVASPYFQLGDRFGGQPAQAVAVSGDFTNTVVHDSYDAEAPAPPPPAVVETASNSSGWAPPAVSPDPGSAQAYAQGAVAARGWGSGEFDCLVALWSRESGWRVNAYNASSGAYGIPQSLPGSKMSSAGSDWETNAGTQIEWGLGYISGRYSSPCGAWAHSEESGWY